MMYICCTVGDDGLDWGQAGEKRKLLPPLCYIWPLRRWLVWESNALFCRCTHMNVFMSTGTYLHAHLHSNKR